MPSYQRGMMQQLSWIARVEGGKLTLKVSEAIAAAIRSLEGKRVELTLREFKKRRSNAQLSYYWAVPVQMITQAFRDAGNMVDADSVHEFLKQEVGCLRQNVVTADGEVLVLPGSTKRLTTVEMEIYLESVRAWAAEVLDIKVPLPNEFIDD